METRGEIKEKLTSYFNGVMIEDNNDRDRYIAQIIDLIPRKVTREDNEMLNSPIPMQEVEEVVNKMAKGKALGIDGLTSNFFHLFWDLIKKEVWAIVEESRSKGGVLKSFNTTFLSLIPMGVGPNSPDKFRPTSLCNVIYKIISKVIENHIKPLLLGLISRK